MLRKKTNKDNNPFLTLAKSFLSKWSKSKSGHPLQISLSYENHCYLRVAFRIDPKNDVVESVLVRT